jgi:2-polyprenyl-6-methoxyphenol hydroxylase-like FAD-dependent oxidoreductase
MSDGLCDVLVVGAGPTGLTLACILARQGVSVRIIDAVATPLVGSKGKGLQPRTLELFDDLDIVDRILAHGVLGMPMCHHDESGKSTVERPHASPPRPDASYLASLIIPQWRVEETLRDKLEQFSVRVEYGTELTTFEQDDDGASARVTPGAREYDSIRARWLVGCDGGKSTVRHLTGISFAGETIESYRMLVADVHASGIDRDHWHTWRVPEGFLALCPLPSTAVFQLQASIGLDQDSAASLQNAQALVTRRTQRDDIQLSNPTWMSLWRANIRMVDRYRTGRVFLAGDSAHVHSPAGGQGMNTGIQDAVNLGWKLGSVLQGAPVPLLDTYQEERLPIAAWVLGISNEILAKAVATWSLQFSRSDQTLQLGLNYRQASLARDLRPEGTGLRAGDRAPEATGFVGADGTRRMFDLLRGPQVTLLGFGAQWRPVVDQCVAAFKGAVKGYTIASEPGRSCSYVDSQGHGRAAYADNTLFIVRPDNYVGMVTAEPDAAKVIQYLQMVCPGQVR